MSYAVGVDLGGTKIAAAVIDSAGRVRHKLKLPVAKESVTASVEQIITAVHQAVAAAGAAWDQIAGIGVAVPGIYFAASGEAWAPNLWGWDRVPLRDALRARFPAPVVIDSDRAAYVLGEQWLGIARGLSDVVFLAVGTGIGAGVITGGKLCRGATDIAGAVGWFAVDPRRKESYRQVGCLEAEAAGPAIARRAAARIAAGETSLMQEMIGADLAAITTEMVMEAARKSDALAQRVLEETAAYLAMGVANIISLLNPQMVVLGGGVMQAGDLWLEPLRREVLEWAQPLAARQTRLELTQLGEDAGLLGAARLVCL
jgi:glucokinase